MPFNILTFVLDKAVAAKQGVSDQRSTELGLIGAMLPLGPIPSLVITQVIAQNEGGSATTVIAPPVTPPPSVQVQVPDVTHGRFDVGRAVLQALGLQVQRQDVISTTVDKEVIISQNPAAGTTVAINSKVILNVNPGIPVPDVTTQPLQAAQAQLQLIGLTGQPVYRPSDVVSPDSVISQSPAPFTLVSPGSAITLVVSLGIPLVDLPNVVDQSDGSHYSFDEAREILQDLDFIIVRKNRPVDIGSPDAGKVLDQDPKPGRVPPETLVTLTVGAEPSVE
jgi:serine/threonine-protein kinase